VLTSIQVAKYILALDQGTTSSRAIVFDRAGRVVSLAQRELPQIFPSPTEVEHDPEAIWSTQLWAARQALRKGRLTSDDVAAVGITNQRETVVLWERASGRPVHNAIVWQSRVSAPICEKLTARGLEPLFQEKTGLLLDPYFSGTKIRHLLDRDPTLRKRARRGEILAGTIDTYLLYRLTGGRVHATDPSNASRTLLYDINTLDWDDELLRILDIPREMLPEVRDSSGHFGDTERKLFGRSISITGIAGDQQAATFGQGCFRRGTAKNTYGTGSFILLNTGAAPVASKHRLLTTVGWRIGGRTTYCLEGSVFIAGAAVQWLRDGLGVIASAADIERLAESVPDAGGVAFVPALVGLGAPHWSPHTRGTIFGVSRGTTAAHIARATLDAIGFQTRDVVDAMKNDSGVGLTTLKVDGGAAANDHLLQIQSDLLGTKIERPVVHETTALGAAYLAGLAVGYWKNLADVAANWQLDRRFEPRIDARERRRRYAAWQRAVEVAMSWSSR